jgi:hypothetical protein
MKNVKPSSMKTPTAESLNCCTANIRPIAPPKNTRIDMPGDRCAKAPVVTPIQAPSTVGISDSVSSQ